MREFGSEFPSIVLSDGYFDSLKRLGHCTFLRSGREALAFAAKNCISEISVVLLRLIVAGRCRRLSNEWDGR